LACWALGVRYAKHHAEVTDRHLQNAARANASQVEFALRR
jgi:hypothetical protein